MWEHNFELQEEARQDNYETEAVKYILRKCGWQAKERELKQFSRSLSHPGLALESLVECTPFPLRLKARKLRRITPDLLLDMQLRPTKTPIFEVFSDLKDEFPEAVAAGTLGLIFAWPQWSKFVLFHLRDTTTHAVGSRWIWYPGRNHQPHIMETLDAFLEAVKLA